MDESDKELQFYINKIKESGTNVKKENCPAESLLSRYIDGVLDENDRERVEKHLADCDTCLNLVLMQKTIAGDPGYSGFSNAPEAWIRRALKLTASAEKDRKEEIVDIVLKFIKGKIEIINNPGGVSILQGAEPVPVRTNGKPEPTNLITLRKNLSGIESEVEVEKITDSHLNMKVATRDINSSHATSSLRISLFDLRGEMASYISGEGTVFFTELKPGKYIIKISDKGKSLGQLSIDLRT